MNNRLSLTLIFKYDLAPSFKSISAYVLSETLIITSKGVKFDIESNLFNLIS